MKFRTTLQLEGKTATGFRVPTEVVEALGQGKKRPPVVVTVNGYTYRSTVAAYGDVFMLPLAAEHRTAAGVTAGDEIDVDLELDTAPREVDVPADFAAALDADPPARRTFDALSNSNKKWHTLNVEGAKSEETRRRRIEKSIATLREGRPR
ncbi:MAG TPA: YdeI/OmpD-associated family protein [Candidatus Limnocylindrales bacterium]